MNEYSDIEKLLSELPEITLPESLSAEKLFAKMDTEGAGQSEDTSAEKNKVVSFVTRYRPLLSYAAVFAVLVLVYYGAGLDRPMVIKQEDTANRLMVADAGGGVSSSAAAVPEAARAPINEAAPAAAPRMMTAGVPCTIESLKAFSETVEKLKLEEGETVKAYLSESDNTLLINIGKTGEERLRKEIAALMEEQNIPEDCVLIITLDL